MTTCPQPQPHMTVRITLPALIRQIAHGTRHMRPADLTIRTVLALGSLVVTAWLIGQGALLWPLLTGTVGALSLAIDAVELYAAGSICQQIAKEQQRGRGR